MGYRDVASNFSSHGLHRLDSANKKRENYRWFGLFVVVLLGFTVHISLLVSQYQKKLTDFNTEIVAPNQGLPFPAVTLCSLNPIGTENLDVMEHTKQIQSAINYAQQMQELERQGVNVSELNSGVKKKRSPTNEPEEGKDRMKREVSTKGCTFFTSAVTGRRYCQTNEDFDYYATWHFCHSRGLRMITLAGLDSTTAQAEMQEIANWREATTDQASVYSAAYDQWESAIWLEYKSKIGTDVGEDYLDRDGIPAPNLWFGTGIPGDGYEGTQPWMDIAMDAVFFLPGASGAYGLHNTYSDYRTTLKKTVCQVPEGKESETLGTCAERAWTTGTHAEEIGKCHMFESSVTGRRYCQLMRPMTYSQLKSFCENALGYGDTITKWYPHRGGWEASLLLDYTLISSPGPGPWDREQYVDSDVNISPAWWLGNDVPDDLPYEPGADGSPFTAITFSRNHDFYVLINHVDIAYAAPMCLIPDNVPSTCEDISTATATVEEPCVAGGSVPASLRTCAHSSAASEDCVFFNSETTGRIYCQSAFSGSYEEMFHFCTSRGIRLLHLEGIDPTDYNLMNAELEELAVRRNQITGMANVDEWSHSWLEYRLNTTQTAHHRVHLSYDFIDIHGNTAPDLMWMTVARFPDKFDRPIDEHIHQCVSAWSNGTSSGMYNRICSAVQHNAVCSLEEEDESEALGTCSQRVWTTGTHSEEIGKCHMFESSVTGRRYCQLMRPMTYSQQKSFCEDTVGYGLVSFSGIADDLIQAEMAEIIKRRDTITKWYPNRGGWEASLLLDYTFISSPGPAPYDRQHYVDSGGNISPAWWFGNDVPDDWYEPGSDGSTFSAITFSRNHDFYVLINHVDMAYAAPMCLIPDNVPSTCEDISTTNANETNATEPCVPAGTVPASLPANKDCVFFKSETTGRIYCQSAFSGSYEEMFHFCTSRGMRLLHLEGIDPTDFDLLNAELEELAARRNQITAMANVNEWSHAWLEYRLNTTQTIHHRVHLSYDFVDIHGNPAPDLLWMTVARFPDKSDSPVNEHINFCVGVWSNGTHSGMYNRLCSDVQNNAVCSLAEEDECEVLGACNTRYWQLGKSMYGLDIPDCILFKSAVTNRTYCINKGSTLNINDNKNFCAARGFELVSFGDLNTTTALSELTELEQRRFELTGTRVERNDRSTLIHLGYFLDPANAIIGSNYVDKNGVASPSLWIGNDLADSQFAEPDNAQNQVGCSVWRTSNGDLGFINEDPFSTSFLSRNPICLLPEEGTGVCVDGEWVDVIQTAPPSACVVGFTNGYALTNTSEVVTFASPGMTVYFHCINGKLMNLTGPSNATCLDSLVFDRDFPTCTNIEITVDSPLPLDFDVTAFTDNQHNVFQTVLADIGIDLGASLATMLNQANAGLSAAAAKDKIMNIDPEELAVAQKQTAAMSYCTFEGQPCYENDTIPKIYINNDYTWCFQVNGEDNVTARRSGTENGYHFILNADNGDHLYTSQLVGSRLEVHDPNERAFPELNGVYLTSKRSYAVTITKSKIIRIANCRHETVYNESVFGNQYRYTVANCLYTCSQSYAMNHCNCSLPEIPTDLDAAGVGVCAMNDCTREAYNVKCDCPLPCEQNQYQLAVTFAGHPIHEYIAAEICSKVSMLVSKEECLERVMNSKSDIHLNYNALSFELITEYYLVDFKSLLNSMANAMGVWIGTSVIAISEIATFVVLVVHKVAKRLSK